MTETQKLKHQILQLELEMQTPGFFDNQAGAQESL
jgi:hypothetical protein